jgi:hypothetical protein
LLVSAGVGNSLWVFWTVFDEVVELRHFHLNYQIGCCCYLLLFNIAAAAAAAADDDDDDDDIGGR